MPFTPNRRSFIIASGMTALASTRVLGANDTLRVGVIGAGGRMRTILDSADKSGIPFQIVAVSDVYGPRRDEVKERSNGIATTHLDYHEVLTKDIDAVLIASPDHWHVRMACDALAAGKDVYLEKPVTHTIEEGSALRQAGFAVRHAATQLDAFSQRGGSDPGRQPGPRDPSENLLVAKLQPGGMEAEAHRCPGVGLEDVVRRGSGSAVQ
jgi:hypothetical protein